MLVLKQVKSIVIDADASVVCVFTDNSVALLYQRFGFTETGREEPLIEMVLEI